MSIDIFVDKYERPDMIKNYINFLRKIEKLKTFLVEFNKNDNIRFKIYLLNYTIIKKDC